MIGESTYNQKNKRCKIMISTRRRIFTFARPNRNLCILWQTIILFSLGVDFIFFRLPDSVQITSFLRRNLINFFSASFFFRWSFEAMQFNSFRLIWRTSNEPLRLLWSISGRSVRMAIPSGSCVTCNKIDFKKILVKIILDSCSASLVYLSLYVVWCTPAALNFAQAHLTLALAASSTPPPAPSVSPK